MASRLVSKIRCNTVQNCLRSFFSKPEVTSATQPATKDDSKSAQQSTQLDTDDNKRGRYPHFRPKGFGFQHQRASSGPPTEGEVQDKIEAQQLQPSNMKEFYKSALDVSAGTYPITGNMDNNPGVQQQRFEASKTYKSVVLPLKLPKLANPFPDPVKIMSSHTVSDQEKAEQMFAESRVPKGSIEKTAHGPMTNPQVRHYAKKVGLDPKKCKKAGKKNRKCPRMKSKHCRPVQRDTCVPEKCKPDCHKIHAPYPSYSESCAEEPYHRPSECRMCPWRPRDNPNFKQKKKKFHTCTKRRRRSSKKRRKGKKHYSSLTDPEPLVALDKETATKDGISCAKSKKPCKRKPSRSSKKKRRRSRSRSRRRRSGSRRRRSRSRRRRSRSGRRRSRSGRRRRSRSKRRRSGSKRRGGCKKRKGGRKCIEQSPPLAWIDAFRNWRSGIAEKTVAAEQPQDQFFQLGPNPAPMLAKSRCKKKKKKKKKKKRKCKKLPFDKCKKKKRAKRKEFRSKCPRRKKKKLVKDCPECRKPSKCNRKTKAEDAAVPWKAIEVVKEVGDTAKLNLNESDWVDVAGTQKEYLLDGSRRRRKRRGRRKHKSKCRKGKKRKRKCKKKKKKKRKKKKKKKKCPKVKIGHDCNKPPLTDRCGRGLIPKTYECPGDLVKRVRKPKKRKYKKIRDPGCEHRRREKTWKKKKSGRHKVKKPKRPPCCKSKKKKKKRKKRKKKCASVSDIPILAEKKPPVQPPLTANTTP